MLGSVLAPDVQLGPSLQFPPAPQPGQTFSILTSTFEASTAGGVCWLSSHQRPPTSYRVRSSVCFDGTSPSIGSSLPAVCGPPVCRMLRSAQVPWAAAGCLPRVDSPFPRGKRGDVTVLWAVWRGWGVRATDSHQTLGPHWPQQVLALGAGPLCLNCLDEKCQGLFQ